MKTKISFLMIVIFSALLLLNCKDDVEPNPVPAAKKYYLSTVTKNSVLAEEFTYNSDNRLIKWQSTDAPGAPYCELSYNLSGVLSDLTFYSYSIYYGNVLVEMNSSKNPLKVTEYTLTDTTTYAFEYNASGNVVKINFYRGTEIISAQNYGYMALTYDANGNISRQVYNEYPVVVNTLQYDYLYDSKKSPVYYTDLKWPYFIIMLYFDDSQNVSYLLSKNNITKNTKTIPAPAKVTNSSYIYNTDGYPTQMTQGTDVFDIDYIVK